MGLTLPVTDLRRRTTLSVTLLAIAAVVVLRGVRKRGKEIA